MLLSNKTISRILETLQEQIHLIGMSGLTLLLQPIFISHCTFFCMCMAYMYVCICIGIHVCVKQVYLGARGGLWMLSLMTFDSIS